MDTGVNRTNNRPFIPDSLLVRSSPNIHYHLISFVDITIIQTDKPSKQWSVNGNEHGEPTHQILRVTLWSDRKQDMVG